MDERLQERFFDYHEDMDPQRAAAIARRTCHPTTENRNNEWVAIIDIERVENAESLPPRDPRNFSLFRIAETVLDKDFALCLRLLVFAGIFDSIPV